MIFKMREILYNGEYRDIIIDNEKLLIKENNEEDLVTISESDSFTTLINLFSLKSEWKKEKVSNDRYTIYFKNKDVEEVFTFDEELPDNWIILNACLSNLVGKYYG